MNTHRDPVIALMPATETDIDFLYQLKSEPDSVYWGGYAQGPVYASLKQHYENILRDPRRATLVVRADDEPVGLISCRFDDDGSCVDYSINISRRAAGRGIGQKALEHHVDLLRSTSDSCRGIMALIRDDNVRSQHVFAAAGFLKTERFEDRLLASDASPVRLSAWNRTWT